MRRPGNAQPASSAPRPAISAAKGSDVCAALATGRLRDLGVRVEGEAR